MPKLDINKLKKEGIAVCETKSEMLEYISKAGFKNRESLIITRYKKKWMLQWKFETMRD